MTDATPDRGPDPAPAPAARRRRWPWAAAAVLAAAALATAAFLWRPWERFDSSCTEDPAHLIDEASRLCYAIPDGWEPMTAAELEEEAALNGLEPFTSGLRSPDDHVAWVEVGTDEHFFSASYPADDLRALAEAVATSSGAMQSADPEVEAETLEIGGRAAATATAQAPDTLFTEEPTGWIMWVRATVVDFGDGAAVMVTTALVEEDELGDEDGTAALLEGVHDSIDVRPQG